MKPTRTTPARPAPLQPAGPRPQVAMPADKSSPAPGRPLKSEMERRMSDIGPTMSELLAAVGERLRRWAAPAARAAAALRRLRTTRPRPKAAARWVLPALLCLAGAPAAPAQNGPDTTNVAPAVCRPRGARIPLVCITTPDGRPITSREHWTSGCSVSVVLPDGREAFHTTTAAVKSRGHSTFTKPKKPYVFRLSSKQGLLGMKKNNQWVLLANFMDHSLLRNSLALAIAKHTGLDWTPDSRLVDVVLNGRLQGCYLLCEPVRVGPQGVDIDKKSGFLVEMDAHPSDDPGFSTPIRHLPVKIHWPKKPTPNDMSNIEKYFSTIEQLLYGDGPDGVKTCCRQYLDINSFADWWLVHELAQNAEPNGPRSCYMHRGDGSGRLKAGPVWDFDLAFITVGLDGGGDLRPARFHRKDAVMLTGDSLYNVRALWYDRLLADKDFRKRVSERWKELLPGFKLLARQIDVWEALIEPSARADEALWKGQDPARFDVFPTFETSVAHLKETYLYRLDRLNRILTHFEDGLK